MVGTSNNALGSLTSFIPLCLCSRIFIVSFVLLHCSVYIVRPRICQKVLCKWASYMYIGKCLEVVVDRVD
jgi:hypothetical protein